MAGSVRRRRFAPNQWLGEFANWRERRAERSAGTPEEALALAERRLEKSLGSQGPDSWRSINAMEAVAKFRERLGAFAEALPLRRQVLYLRKKHLGSDDQLTLAAEARLAVTLLELRRPGEAKPLFEHVLAGLAVNKGQEDLTLLAVRERLADTELAMGEAKEARALLRQTMDRYQERGDELLAAGAAVNLARALIRDGEYAEAPELLRTVVEVRSRLLGPDDPETLSALRNLANSLVWTKEFPEASIVANNLHTRTLTLHGPDHGDTEAAERLATEIEARLAEQ